MKQVFLLIGLLSTVNAHALFYSDYEIDQQLNQTVLQDLSTQYIHSYFNNQQPTTVIEELFKAEMSPLQREYILFNLLTAIAQQPPQHFHQDFINRMKTYAIQATRTADEGHLPVAVFNLNSKAYGIENIWSAYRSEQRFNQLFKQDMYAALDEINSLLQTDSSQRRPQWLGVKNSIAALDENKFEQLVNMLSTEVKANSGLDPLLSHVGLFSGHVGLIEKALTSKQAAVRQLTLRHLPQHLTAQLAKSMLIQSASNGVDSAFSTALLSQFTNDQAVQSFLLQQLKNSANAESAAFALSQSNHPDLPLLLKEHYLLSNNSFEKNHLLLALKLNPSSTAKLAVDDLKHQIKPNSAAGLWLQSFEHKSSGEQP